MQLKQLLSDDDAVSPVIGVILMVAITVILAAVIATFVLGLGDQVSETAPTASISTDYSSTGNSDGRLTITHDGGDTIQSTEIFVRGQNGSNGNAAGESYNDAWQDFVDGGASAGGNTDGSVSAEQAGQSAVAAGDFIEFGVGSDAELRIVYDAQQGDSTATLARFEGPDA